ncbi:response regulator [bacterium]|nr:response regulator [bacterium]
MGKILIIDDEDGVDAAIDMALPEYEAHHAGTMTEAISALKAQAFEVVFLDLKLPDSNPDRTIMMIPIIRRLAGQAALIAMSGYRAPAIEAAGFADAVLNKPFHSGHIREAVRKAQQACKEHQFDPAGLYETGLTLLFLARA